MPHIMRRLLVVPTVAAVVGVTLAACGSSGDGGSDSGGPVTLTLAAALGAPNTQQTIDELITRFESANPGVSIKPTYTPYATFDQILGTQINSGNVPDLILSTGGSYKPTGTASLAEKKLLMDMSDQEWAADIPEVFTPAVEHDGKIYGWAPDVTIFTSVYNTTAVESAGTAPPRSWSEVLPYCRAMRAANKTPYSLPLADPTVGGVQLDQFVATTVYADDPKWDQQRADGETSFASTAGWETGLDKFMEMKDAGCFSENATAVPQQTSINDLSTGAAGGWLVTHQLLAYLQTPGQEYAAIPFPSEDQGNNVMAGPLSVWSASARTDHPEAAKAWLDFVANSEQNRWYSQQTGGLSMADYIENKLPANLDEFTPYVADDKITAFHQVWKPGVAEGVFGPGIQSMYLGNTTPSNLLADTDAAWDSAR